MLSREVDVYVMNSLSGRLGNVTEQGRHYQSLKSQGRSIRVAVLGAKVSPQRYLTLVTVPAHLL